MQRHTLAYLSAKGWKSVEAQVSGADEHVRECVRYWTAQSLPLVITRQADCRGHVQHPDVVAVGLPAPLCWKRRRIALNLPITEILFTDVFPSLQSVLRLLPRRAIAGWSQLTNELVDVAYSCSVFGSYGWQCLSGLAYIRRTSDIDILVRVPHATAADRAAAILARWGETGPRLDGELLFPTGAAVSWREWLFWRATRSQPGVSSILVKRTSGVALEEDLAFTGAQSVSPSSSDPVAV